MSLLWIIIRNALIKVFFGGGLSVELVTVPVGNIFLIRMPTFPHNSFTFPQPVSTPYHPVSQALMNFSSVTVKFVLLTFVSCTKYHQWFYFFDFITQKYF